MVEGDDVRAAEPAGGKPAGRVVVAINAKAGTARVTDRGVITEKVRKAVEPIGDLIEVVFIEPRSWRFALETMARREDVDSVVVGGGDGSISTAGAIFTGSGKAMGVLPLGTFNLFARSLRLPIGLDGALEALSRSVPQAVDVGELADGGGVVHTFLHHVSLGFHPRFIATRELVPYASRIGKMLASLRVFRQTLRTLRRITLALSGDIERPRERLYQLTVTVGSFREGFGDFPHAEDLTAGDLDVVMLPARSRLDFLVAAFKAAIGRWRFNDRLEVVAVRKVRLSGWRRRMTVSIDGELARLRLPFDLRVRPRALLVLRPAEAA